MPGYGSWKQIYCDEFQTLTDKGYDTESAVLPKDSKTPLPFPDQKMEENDRETEAFWEKSYHELWKIREQGIRSDYPYREPDDFAKIMQAAPRAPELK